MRRTKQDLRECCQQGDGLKAAPGLLQNVKVCGLESANGRRYLPEALSGALPLYEGCMVNIDHPAKAEQPRNLHDRFGQLTNLRIEGGVPRADLAFNPFHPMAESVKWWAENNPRCIGLSHNAIGQGHDEDGVFVVEKILAVRSVDLVADPATTKGLFESRLTSRARGEGGRAVSRAEFASALRTIQEGRRRQRVRSMSQEEFLRAITR